MSKKDHPSDATAELRRKAEKKALKENAFRELIGLSPEEASQMWHELRVHQVELEMQNEELRRSQVALDASRANYFDLYDLAPVGYLTVSELGLIQEANLTAAGLLSVERLTLLKQPFTHFILPDDQDVYYHHQRRLFGTGTPQVSEIRMFRGRESHFWARLESTKAQSIDGGKAVCRVVLSDLTAYKETERKLQSAEKQLKLALEKDIRSAHATLRLIIDSVPQIIAWKDRASVYLGCNRNFADLMGLPSPEAVIGRNDSDLHAQGKGTDILIDGDRLLMETGQPKYHLAELVLTPDGRKVWLDVSKIPLKDERDQIIGVLLTAEDVTERVKVQNNMVLLNKRLAKESRQRRIMGQKLLDKIEKDRQDVARDLHDDVGQIATTLKQDVEQAIAHAHASQSSMAPKLEGILSKTTVLITKVSETARRLRPSLLDDLGLIPSLSSLFQTVEKSSGLKIDFFTQNVPSRFERPKELALYRIAQEAMNNILKHARASQVYVNLLARDGTVLLTIEDDGQGFDLKKTQRSPEHRESWGLILMKERALKLKGRLLLDSSPGRGTQVHAEIPLKVNNEPSKSR